MHDSPTQQHAHEYGGGAVLDSETLDTLRSLGGAEDPGLLLELVALFLTDATDRMQTLSAAWDSGDLETVSRCAHTLKSASANIGALGFSGSCKDVELAAKTGERQGVGGHVERCLAMYSEVESALQALQDPA